MNCLNCGAISKTNVLKITLNKKLVTTVCEDCLRDKQLINIVLHRRDETGDLEGYQFSGCPCSPPINRDDDDLL